MKALFGVLLTIAWCVAVWPATAADLTVTYIANEGVLVSDGERTVLIDGLYREGVPGYATIPTPLLNQLERAEPPYDAVDLLLVTHSHRDHFDPRAVASHLQHNRRATLIASEEIIAEVEKVEDGNVTGERALAVTPPWQERAHMSVAGLEVQVLRMRHGTPRNYHLQHLGFIVDFGEARILHIGDVEMIVENFEPFDLVEQRIDIAFIPDWMLYSRSGVEIIKSHVQPRHIIAVHMQPGGGDVLRERIADTFPDAVILENPLDQWKLPQ